MAKINQVKLKQDADAAEKAQRFDRAIVGGSGSEVILIPVLAMQMNSNCDTWSPMVHGPFFVNLDAGERLSAVAQADTTTAEVRDFAVSILGYD